MVKSRFAGLAGRSFVARFCVAIEGYLHLYLHLLACVKGHEAPGCERVVLAGLRIASVRLGLLPQLAVPEPGKLYRLAALESNANLLEERLDHVLGLALVEADLFEHEVGQLGLGKGDLGVFHVRGWALNCWKSKSR